MWSLSIDHWTLHFSFESINLSDGNEIVAIDVPFSRSVDVTTRLDGIEEIVSERVSEESSAVDARQDLWIDIAMNRTKTCRRWHLYYRCMPRKARIEIQIKRVACVSCLFYLMNTSYSSGFEKARTDVSFTLPQRQCDVESNSSSSPSINVLIGQSNLLQQDVRRYD
jgi:hypothetical protein